MNIGFILRIQDVYCAERGKLYMCFVDLEKAFYRLSRKVFELLMKKKGIA